MKFTELEQLLSAEPAYRLKQIKRLVFVELIAGWESATTLSKSLRAKLSAEAPLEINAKLYSGDEGNTVKAAITLEDGLVIEAVLMRSIKNRNTVCVSTQVGCALGCEFCATGKMGFKRNLTVDEIVDQVMLFARILKKENQKITNIVFMGMGEPMLNYDNVLSSIRLLHDEEGFNLGVRHFSISTVGIIPGIEKLAKEKMDVNLAISLHSADESTRSRIIPVNKKYPLKKIIAAVDDYIEKKNRQVMFEYIMLRDINDTDENARQLAKIMKKPLYHVNLIPYNITGDFEPSGKERIRSFKSILERAGVSVSERFRHGSDIDAACGQLAGIAKER